MDGAKGCNVQHAKTDKTRGTRDLSNQLVRVLQNSNQVAEYTYNGAGQRMKKVTQTETRIFHYDLLGHLIAETNQSGQTLAEYVYLGDTLLAMMKPGESVYYFHNDHLGTPQVLTDDTQAIAWNAAYTPFGDALASIENVENPFRFPGQYYDPETGLHYNYFRYYNPQTGRYITPDPIGLEGGINLFAYVQNNPLKFIDPFGLAEHHIVPKAIWERMAELSKETKAVFNKAVVEAGEHYNWDLHRKYSKHVREMWQAFFKDVKPCEISKDMAEKFVKTVKSDPKARSLLIKILQRGGAPIPTWLVKGSRFGSIAWGAFTAVLFDWILPNEAQAPTFDDPPLWDE